MEDNQLEARIQVVMDTLEVSSEQARLALDLAGGELEQALKMKDYVDPAILILHGMAVSGKKNEEYALFLLVLHGREGQVLRAHSVVNYREELAEKDPEISTEAFLREIQEIRTKGDDRSGARLSSYLVNEMSSTAIYRLFDLAREGNEEGLKLELTEKLYDFFNRPVRLKIKSTLFTKKQCLSHGIHLEEEPEEEQEEEEDEESSFLLRLDVSPVIDPSKGKSPEELEEGDEIPVRISDDREIAEYLDSLLTDEDDQLVRSWVKEVSYDQDTERYLTLVRLGPGIEGKFIIDPDIRIALQIKRDKTDEKQDKDQGVELYRSLVLGVILLSLLIIIILVIRIW